MIHIKIQFKIWKIGLQDLNLNSVTTVLVIRVWNLM